MKEENSLAIEAKNNIEICCTTLCEKEVVIQYIKQLEEENQKLKLLLAERS
tara:strand:+ start:203 stop:355 length:153 start_codon:yes stop_codon:yes gene_type:complete